MINENTKLFILDNLNKRDFLTEEFLNELKEVMDFYDNLYLYFNGFELKDSSLANTTGGYDRNDKKVYLFKREMLIEFKNFLKINKLDSYDITRINIFMTHLIMHELSHAYQKYLMHMSTNWDSLISDSLLTIDGRLTPYKILDYSFVPNKIKHNLIDGFYLKHHDLFPNELLAEGNALDITNDIIKRMDDYYKYSDYVYYYISILLSHYKITKKEIICPLERFYKKIKLELIYREYDFSEFTDKEKFLYGMTKDKDVINNQLNTILNSRDIDFVDKIRYEISRNNSILLHKSLNRSK